MTAARQLHLFKSSRQRGVKPPPVAEFALQCVVADVLDRWADPEWEWTHFPAGELRDKATAGRLKRAGTRRGWPDIQLLSPTGVFHGLELKTGYNKQTADQERIEASLLRKGCVYEVARSVGEAVDLLKGWGVVPARVRISA